MKNFISLRLISLFRLLIYNDYIYGAVVTIFMWSLNPSDKLADLGSMAVEEPKVCNCYCFYQFLLQPSLNFLALCTSDKSLLNCACRSTFIFDCSIDVLQIMYYMYYIYSLSHSLHISKFEEIEHDIRSIRWQSESFCVTSLIRETFRHRLQCTEDRLKHSLEVKQWL